MRGRFVKQANTCYALLATLALATLSVGNSAPVTVSNELSFFSALINNSVSHIMLNQNIKLQPEFWGNTWAAVNVSRDLTLEGTNADWASFIQLDLSFIQSKVVLSEGVTITMRRLELLNVFSRIQRSYDFFAASTNSTTVKWVEIIDHLLICMPLDFAVTAWRGSPRPTDNPGQQNLSLITDDPYCSRSSSRCFTPYFYTWNLVTTGTRGYNLAWEDVSTICDGFATQACLDELGADMCYATSLQTLLKQRRQQQAAQDDAGGKGSLSARAKAGIIAGCVVAGVVACAAVAWLLAGPRNRHRQAQHGTKNDATNGDGGGKGLYSEDVQARTPDTMYDSTSRNTADLETGGGLDSMGMGDPKDRKTLDYVCTSNDVLRARAANSAAGDQHLLMPASPFCTTANTALSNTAAVAGGSAGVTGPAQLTLFGHRGGEASCPDMLLGTAGGGGAGDGDRLQPCVQVRCGSNSNSSISNLGAALAMLFRSLLPGHGSNSGVSARHHQASLKAVAVPVSGATQRLRFSGVPGVPHGSGDDATSDTRVGDLAEGGYAVTRDLHHTGSFKLTQRNSLDNRAALATNGEEAAVSSPQLGVSRDYAAAACNGSRALALVSPNNGFAPTVTPTSAGVTVASASSRDASLLLVHEVLRGAGGGGAMTSAARAAAVAGAAAIGPHQPPGGQASQGAGGLSAVAAAQDVMLGQPLGAGSFGKVYRGLWRGVTVAVKVISHDRNNSLESIENELRLSLGFDHPNVVRALSFITCSVDEDGKPTLSMLARDALPWAAGTRLFGAGGGDDGCRTMSTLGFADGGSLEGAPRDMLAALYDGAVAESQRRCVAETWVIQEFMDRGTLSGLIKNSGFLLPSPAGDAAATKAALAANLGRSAATGTAAVNATNATSESLGALQRGPGSAPPGFHFPALQPAASGLPSQEKSQQQSASLQQQQPQPQQPLRPQPSNASQPHLVAQPPTAPLPRPPLDMRRVVLCALDVARGLQYMHGLNVCHGDLKPGNILLVEEPNSAWGLVAKLADFGLSRALASDRTHTTTNHHGTVSYMAPEVLGSGKVSTASCIYSYGIILWELVSGRPPYGGMIAGMIIRAVMLEDLRPDFAPLLLTTSPKAESGSAEAGGSAGDDVPPPPIPAWYPDLARLCWHKDPEARPTAAHIVQELEARLLEL